MRGYSQVTYSFSVINSNITLAFGYVILTIALNLRL